jgi:uncharacterized protein (DUF983 family)
VSRVVTVLRRGVSRRCPHCGRGPLFERWFTLFERCSACGYRYQRNYGDTWFFWIIGDRIPIAVGIAVLYFGFRASSWMTLAGFFLAMIVPLVCTMPHRMGVAIALDYLSRVYLPDPSEQMPPLPQDQP